MNWKYDVATLIAERLRGYPEAIRVEVAGSIRRRKEEPKDIEICCLVKPELDLFKTPLGPSTKLMDVMAEDCKVNKRGTRYAQFVYRSPKDRAVNVDFFQTEDPEAWGGMFAIRTGPSEYSKSFMIQWRKLTGGTCRGNILRRADGTKCPALEEQDFFKLIEFDYRLPHLRGQ